MGDYEGELVVIDSVYDNERDDYWAIVMDVSDEPKRVKEKEKLGYILREGEDAEIIAVDELLGDPIYFQKGDEFKEKGEFCNDKGGQESGTRKDGKTCLPPLDIPDRRKLVGITNYT